MTTTLKIETAGATNLEEAIIEAITEARTTCELDGSDSAGCAVA
ncbi:hypothetical protein ANSO36C_19690 [Nostoc cf. commune SO-36]|uniref:Uncharacterized protein n=1 Tax=Nostoc cf. commune SO-36 TaxID=449208 RepID=A0ABN6PYU2_NOSCO|nr:hypothetical protein ANSO36C_19690 [Nostoc cf. commune SO-36]